MELSNIEFKNNVLKYINEFNQNNITDVFKDKLMNHDIVFQYGFDIHGNVNEALSIRIIILENGDMLRHAVDEKMQVWIFDCKIPGSFIMLINYIIPVLISNGTFNIDSIINIIKVDKSDKCWEDLFNMIECLCAGVKVGREIITKLRKERQELRFNLQQACNNVASLRVELIEAHSENLKMRQQWKEIAETEDVLAKKKRKLKELCDY